MTMEESATKTYWGKLYILDENTGAVVKTFEETAQRTVTIQRDQIVVVRKDTDVVTVVPVKTPMSIRPYS